MADNNQAIEWYLARDGQQHGPVTDAELRKIIELGYLKPSDLVWRQGMAEWGLAEQVLDLKAASPPPPSPPAPEPVAPASYPQARRAPTAPAHGSVSQPQLQAQPSYPQGDPRRGPQGGQGYAQQSQPRPAAAQSSQAPYQRADGGAGYPQPGPGGPRRADSGFDNPRDRSGPQPYAGPGGTIPKPGLGGNAPDRRPPPSDDDIDQHDEPEGSGFPWRTAAVLVVLAGLAAGGFALYRTGKLDSLPFLSAPSAQSKVPVVNRPNAPAKETETASTATLVLSGNSQAIDHGLQGSPLWQRLKRDFPDWYKEKIEEIARMTGESKSDREINGFIVRAVVELRRRHFNDALAASPERLTSIAQSFVDSLARLSRESTALCYGFISQGEASPAIADLKKPDQRAALDAQLAAIFDAVAEGRKAPVKREAPRREDYDALSGELGKRGWSAADLQLFTDARALSRAAPEKVCQMVQDWFQAQLSVEDEAARVRLLGEALKPVVAG